MTSRIMAILGEGPVEGGGKYEGEQVKKEGSFVLMVKKLSPVHVRDTGGGIGGDVSMVGGDTSTRLKLFFLFGTVQMNDFWILAYSGSARNLIVKETLIKLPFRTSLVDK